MNNNNVIYMGDFLLRRHKNLKEKQENLARIAASVSKSDNPRNDAFSGPLLAKADRFKEPIENVERHIRFIIHGGNRPAPVMPSGYSLQYRQPTPLPPPVRIATSAPVQS